jgi:hypothetical protein
MTTVDLSFSGQLAEVAVLHDKRVRQIEAQITGAWSELAELAIQVRDHGEWQVLGFHSFNSWLLDAAPRSRAMIYSAMGLLEELRDVPMDELRCIGIGAAHVLKKLPRASRARPEILEAAKTLQPRNFLATVMESHPAELLEETVTPRLKFTVSQWVKLEEIIEKAMAMFEVSTKAEAIEAVLVDWDLSQ